MPFSPALVGLVGSGGGGGYFDPQQQELRRQQAQQLLAAKVLSQPGININDPNSVRGAFFPEGAPANPNAFGAYQQFLKTNTPLDRLLAQQAYNQGRLTLGQEKIPIEQQRADAASTAAGASATRAKTGAAALGQRYDQMDANTLIRKRGQINALLVSEQNLGANADANKIKDYQDQLKDIDGEIDTRRANAGLPRRTSEQVAPGETAMPKVVVGASKDNPIVPQTQADIDNAKPGQWIQTPQGVMQVP